MAYPEIFDVEPETLSPAGGKLVSVVGTPTNGQVPTWSAANTRYEPQTPSGGGGGSGALVLLEQHTASSSASLDFTTCISATYDEYLIEFLNIVPATANADFRMRMSTNGGSSYDSGTNYASANFVWRAAAISQAGAEGGETAISITRFAISTSAQGVCGTARLFSPAASLFKQVIGEVGYLHTQTGTFRLGETIRCGYESTTAVNAFQFFMTSGNIASGIIRVYGLAK